MEENKKITLAIGHSLMDLDSLGSLAIAQVLFDCYAVRSKLSHPVAYNLYNLFKDYLAFKPHSYLSEIGKVSSLIVVDTKDVKRIKEVLEVINDDIEQIDVYDHHHDEECTIPNAIVHNNNCGANTSYLVLMAMQKQIIIPPQIATIALTAIYSDTGSFKHSNVVADDFKAATYLMQCGANIGLIKHFLKPPLGSDFETLIYQAKSKLEQHLILGKYVTFFYIEIDKQLPGLSLIIEQLFEIEQPYALIGCIGLVKNNQIVVSGRSSDPSINVNKLLKNYGGGGHIMASSATIKERLGSDIVYELISELRKQIDPEKNAIDLADKDIPYIGLTLSMQEVEDFLTLHNLTGTVVIDENGKLAGSISLHQVNLAKKNNAMSSTIKGYLKVEIPSCSPSTSLNEIENIFFTKTIGRLPIVDEENKVLGIITRRKYLSFLQDRSIG